jgi:hypothetical protein
MVYTCLRYHGKTLWNNQYTLKNWSTLRKNKSCWEWKLLVGGREIGEGDDGEQYGGCILYSCMNNETYQSCSKNHAGEWGGEEMRKNDGGSKSI